MNKYIRAHSEVAFLMCFYDMLETEARRQVLFDELVQVHAQARRRCKKFGHSMTSTDYGGSESGAVELLCNRCGLSKTFIFY